MSSEQAHAPAERDPRAVVETWLNEELRAYHQGYGAYIGVENYAAELLKQAGQFFVEGEDEKATAYRSFAEVTRLRAKQLYREWQDNLRPAERIQFYRALERLREAGLLIEHVEGPRDTVI
jgi:hypothetical protein